MDQVRMVLGWLKRHHFWVLCVLVAGIALWCWYGAASALQQEFAQNQNTIKQEFNSQSTLRGQPFHANDAINTQQTEEIKKQSESVSEAWERLYNRQREEVLKWPSELSGKFRDYVTKLKFGEPIPADLRSIYQNYVGNHFRKLPEKVGARILTAGETGGSGRGRGSMGRTGVGRSGREIGTEGEAQEEFMVEWLDQQVVRDSLDMPREPSAMRIWVTQEDLWVYHTLLQIIANTNAAAGADRYSNAAVRVIESLEVGRPAAAGGRGSGRIMMTAPPSGGAGDAAASEAPVDGGGETAGESIGIARGGSEASDGNDAAVLLAGRYVDAQGQPIASTEPSSFGLEYKRLPVRMRLVMDQRWLSHLISECANAPLQVEVQEVRINPSETALGSGAFDRGSGGGGGSIFRSSDNRGQAMVFPQEPNMLPIVIQGVIYIFNEPDAATLQVSEDQV